MKHTGVRRCCGIDVHKAFVTVCVLPPDGREGEPKRQKFRTFTRDLIALRTWLGRCGVTDVVMESTGQYWRPVWNILEESSIKLVLMNPQHVKGLRGRKTDPLDAEWLARHLARGELCGSFVPPRAISELRELTRLRVNLLQDLNRTKNRIGQVCETANIKVSAVASHLFGVSGRLMLNALIEGKRDAGWMADYARGRLRGKKKELELALEGRFNNHHRDVLQRLLAQMAANEELVKQLEQAIEQRMAPYAEQIARLSTIPGIDRISAWTVLAEIGPDMSVFGDAKHLASWAAVCPGNCESGGHRYSGRTRKGNPALRRVLCQAAQAAAHTKGTYLAAFYHRIQSRKGHPKAIIALAHHLLVVIFHILRDGTSYQELGGDYYDLKNRQHVVDRMIERIQRLGYYVTLQPAASPFAEPIPPPPAPSTASLAPRPRGRPCKCASRGIPCHHKQRSDVQAIDSTGSVIT